MIEDLVELVCYRPDVWQEELVEFLEVYYRVSCYCLTVSRALTAVEFTRKVLSIQAA